MLEPQWKKRHDKGRIGDVDVLEKRSKKVHRNGSYSNVQYEEPIREAMVNVCVRECW